MAHYAFLDENNIVTEVITGRNEDEVVNGISDWETYYGNFRGQKCLRTSYNNNIRKIYAVVGGKYDPIADEFIPPQPFASWTLNSNNDWKAPVENVNDGWIWDEASLSWIDPLTSFID
jgi:hypothetical protein